MTNVETQRAALVARMTTTRKDLGWSAALVGSKCKPPMPQQVIARLEACTPASPSGEPKLETLTGGAGSSVTNLNYGGIKLQR
jgi:hypothetical protein